ncbi:MAG TPA: aminotransferase class I/II-fold pyridoxal phosphate-dependent enzyme, partial [Sphaerochaeta sp.]|nr:aminotransferase class I/II-fold pyridoxal phosphate-dependent enzyme [Sphaerochaeta sp.]
LAWDNYELIFAHQAGGRVLTFDFYTDAGLFNVAGLKEAILSSGTKEIRLLLNFPNNPTGYTPTEKEMGAMVDTLIEFADDGYHLLVITDDAYFGLFFEEEVARESIFAALCDAHENIFAIKCDAATKEDLVWGFRIGFLTYGSKAFDDAHLDALIKRTLGAIRVSVSNCDKPGQSLLLWAMERGKSYEADKEAVFVEMQNRYREVKRALIKYEDNTLLVPRPFNSGYFMSFATAGSAEELRTYLLDRYQIGCINIADVTLRVAYCSVECDMIEELIDCIYQAAGEIWN